MAFGLFIRLKIGTGSAGASPVAFYVLIIRNASTSG